jgi:hypothetical protein
LVEIPKDAALSGLMGVMVEKAPNNQEVSARRQAGGACGWPIESDWLLIIFSSASDQSGMSSLYLV